MQQTFKERTKHPGFTNSILEKYVFVPPGVRMLTWPQGEVLMLNAQPIPASAGHFNRFVIFQNGTNAFGSRGLDEAEIQYIFQKAGMIIPKPEPMEPVQYSPETLELERAMNREKTEFVWNLLRDRLQSKRAVGSGVGSHPGPTGSAGSGKAVPNGPLAEATPSASAVPWLAIAVLVLGGGLLVFLLRRGGRSKLKGP